MEDSQRRCQGRDLNVAEFHGEVKTTSTALLPEKRNHTLCFATVPYVQGRLLSLSTMFKTHTSHQLTTVSYLLWAFKELSEHQSRLDLNQGGSCLQKQSKEQDNLKHVFKKKVRKQILWIFNQVKSVCPSRLEVSEEFIWDLLLLAFHRDCDLPQPHETNIRTHCKSMPRQDQSGLTPLSSVNLEKLINTKNLAKLMKSVKECLSLLN
ncbi:uncharacterized protein LOC129051679 [Pongo abelii]|uniref:uncharacterized protein LOC129051679 n=1 Tax=Pongo abelii TaxID=9601 RepID=UPI00300636BE